MNVTKDDLEKGLRLTAGESVVLLVDGLRGTPREPDAPATPPSAGPPGAAQAGASGERAPAAIVEPALPASAAATAVPSDAPATPTSDAPPPPASADPSADPPAAPVQPKPKTATASLLATLDSIHFEFDKAFALSSVAETCRAIALRAEAEPARKLVIAGHTDPKGTDTYNLALSRERAEAIRAFLLDDAGAWLQLYDHAEHSRRWGTREDQLMLAALPHGGTPFLAAPGTFESSASRAAVRSFQNGKGLAADGIPGPITRRALIEDYMAAPGTSLAPGTAVQLLGCGFRHPPEGAPADPALWRRVEVFLFEEEPRPPAAECEGGAHPGCTVPEQWRKEAQPLPRDGIAPCLILAFSAEGEIASPGGTKASLVETVSGPPQVHEGQKATLSWTLSGDFSTAVIDPGGLDAKAQGVTVGTTTKGTTQVLPLRKDAVGDDVTFTLTVTPLKGAALVSKVVIKLVATPDYFEFPTLVLAAAGTTDPPASDPLFRKFVQQVKVDLRAARYLPDGPPPDDKFGPDLTLAIQRFKRAAQRRFRMLATEEPGLVFRPAGTAPDVDPKDVLIPAAFSGGPLPLPDGTLDAKAAKHLHEWATKSLVRPVGRFQVVKLTVRAPHAIGLRADAQLDWEAVADLAAKAGIPIDEPYGDTKRPLSVKSAVSSATSRHYAGLAVDFNQHHLQAGYVSGSSAGPSVDCQQNGCFKGRHAPDGSKLTTEADVRKAQPVHQRYYLEAIDAKGAVIGLPTAAAPPFWRVWAKLDFDQQILSLPAGVATLAVTAAAPHQQVILSGAPQLKVSLAKMPVGTYADLSGLLESTGKFTRIQSNGGYLDGDGNYGLVEWWHWTYCQDFETPFSTRIPFAGGSALYAASFRFLDACELINEGEGKLIAAGLGANLEKQCF